MIGTPRKPNTNMDGRHKQQVFRRNSAQTNGFITP